MEGVEEHFRLLEVKTERRKVDASQRQVVNAGDSDEERESNGQGEESVELPMEEEAVTTGLEEEDADDSDRQELSADIQVKAESGFGAAGDGHLGDGLVSNCDDDAKEDCEFVSAIEFASGCDGAEHRFHSVEVTSVDRHESVEILMERLQEEPEVGATHEERPANNLDDEEACGPGSQSGLMDNGVIISRTDREERADAQAESTVDVTCGVDPKADVLQESSNLMGQMLRMAVLQLCSEEH